MAAVPRIYTLSQIQRAIDSPDGNFEVDLIQAVQESFVAYSAGKFNAAAIATLGAPPLAPYGSNHETNYAAQTCIKSGYMTGDDHFVIKVASGGYPLPCNTGLLQVFSQTTGRLESLLLDEGILTEHRTAAAGAVAAKYLAPKNVSCIGIIGTGVQARYQLQYLKFVIKNCRNIMVWGRTASNVAIFVEESVRNGWAATVADSPSDLFEQCDLIVTTTSARKALLHCSTNPVCDRRPKHITCIGADCPGKMECDSQLVASADMVVADSLVQTVERGEFQTAVRSGILKLENVVEFGDLILNMPHLHRSENDDRLTIFDSSGVAAQDCAVAKLVSKLLDETT